MKAQINLSCEFNEIPLMVEDLLQNLWDRHYGKLGSLLSDVKKACGEGGDPLTTLTKIDTIRLELKKMDDRLQDCTSILHGFIKAQADLTTGQEINTIPPDVVEETNAEIQND